MADRLRIVTQPDDGRPGRVLIDLSNGTTLAPVRDTFAFTPPASTPITATLGARWGGSRAIGESHENGSVAVTLLVRAGTADATMQLASSILSQIDATLPRGTYLEWRPDGATYSTYFELRGPSTWAPTYRWIVFQGTRSLELALTFSTAPLALGDRMDIWDDFSQDTQTDWVVEVGGGLGLLVDPANGVMKPNTTGIKQGYHAGRGYQYDDVQVTMKWYTGLTSAGTGGVMAKRVSSSVFLTAVFNASTNTLAIIKNNATTLASVAAGLSAAADRQYWIRIRTDANNVTAELWTVEPNPQSTPSATVSTVLTGADATTFGQGVVGYTGIWSNVANTSERYDDFRVEPYTFTRTFPDHVDLNNIPGDAPALMDLTASHGAATAVGYSGICVGWGKKPIFNFLYYGDDNWANFQSFGLKTATPGTLTTTTPGKFGTSALTVTTDATATTNQGTATRVYQRFRKGITYTATIWAQTLVAASWEFGVSNLAGTDGASTGATITSGSWTQYTVSWTPSADADGVEFYFRRPAGASVAQAASIDAAALYEGATAPTGMQAEGSGAYAPLGAIEAESNGSSGGMTMTTDANARNGRVLRHSCSGSAENFSPPSVYFNPSLLDPDDFSESFTVEVWARLSVPTTAVNPRVLLVAQTNFSALTYTQEYGNTSRAILAQNNPQLTRLGTLVLPITNYGRGADRWLFQPQFSVAAGSTGNIDLDYFFLVPAKDRASTLTGKAASTVPAFISFGAGGGATRRIRSDLIGTAASVPTTALGSPPNVWSPGPGMGGALMEPGPGPTRLAVLVFGTGLPDDPAGANDGTVADKTMTVHASITPRWRYARGS